jgi:hypothetical protein
MKEFCYRGCRRATPIILWAMGAVALIMLVGGVAEQYIPIGAFVGTGIIEYSMHLVRVGVMSMGVVGGMLAVLYPVLSKMNVGE